MLAPSDRLLRLALCGGLAVASCAIFPDEARLPGRAAAAGAGGASSAGEAGAAGAPDVIPSGGLAAGGAPQAGMPGVAAGVGGAEATLGGAEATLGGAAGQPAAPCEQPKQATIAVDVDTWVDAAQPSTGHPSDTSLFVTGGAAERRAFLQLTLPAAPAGAVLVSAVLTLQLHGNADVGLAARKLALHRLDQLISASRTTWNNYSNGASRQWQTPGGDFGPLVAELTLPAATASGAVAFDVTGPISGVFAAEPVTVAVVVLEIGSVPAPAELAFTSREGDASGVPALSITYCEP